jgi:hypothetical protein
LGLNGRVPSQFRNEATGGIQTRNHGKLVP